jgi:hypothetical protein
LTAAVLIERLLALGRARPQRVALGAETSQAPGDVPWRAGTGCVRCSDVNLGVCASDLLNIGFVHQRRASVSVRQDCDLEHLVSGEDYDWADSGECDLPEKLWEGQRQAVVSPS